MGHTTGAGVGTCLTIRIALPWRTRANQRAFPIQTLPQLRPQRTMGQLGTHIRIVSHCLSAFVDSFVGSTPKSNVTDCFYSQCGGGGGIRTHEGLLTLAGFQDQCIRPLCHPSKIVLSYCAAHFARLLSAFQEKALQSLIIINLGVIPFRIIRLDWGQIKSL